MNAVVAKPAKHIEIIKAQLNMPTMREALQMALPPNSANLDRFLRVAITAIGQNPELLKQAPYTTPVRRLDETAAARQPVVRQALGA